MALSEIFCQDQGIATLQHAYAGGRMAHAYLFSGDDGVGKNAVARAWARMLLCENRQQLSEDPPFYDSCGRCHACTAFDAGGHPDFRPVYKELIQYTEKGKNRTTPVDMPIDVIREFLIEKVANRPTMADFVVYVVDEAEKVNRNSQNAMLKVLEEPPAFCVIILLCSRLDKMLPTTLSRCQLVRFGPIDTAKIIDQLQAEGTNASEATYWARFSQGSLGRALEWAKLQFEGGAYAIKRELVEKLAALTLADAVDTAEWMGKSARTIANAWKSTAENVSTTDINRRAQKGLIQMVISALNDAMRLGVGQSQELVNQDQERCIETLSSRYDSETAARQIEMCYRIHRWIDSSVNEKLIFEQLLLNLSSSDILFSLTDASN